MSKFIYTLLLSFFIAAPVFALKEGDTVYVDYDLQGGVNNPDNISFFIHSDLSSVRYGLLPPTKEAAYQGRCRISGLVHDGQDSPY